MQRGFPVAIAAWLGALGMGLAASAQDPAPPDAPAPTAIDEVVVDRAVRELGAADFRTRATAERQLIELGRACLPRLRWWLDHTDDAEVRFRVRRICVTLGWIDPADARRALHAARADLLADDAGRRARARATIVRVGPSDLDTVQALACRDADWRVRRTVAELLPQISHREVPGILIAQLSDTDAFVRSGAGASLQDLTGQRFPSHDLAAWRDWWQHAAPTWRPPTRTPPPPHRPPHPQPR